MLAAKNAPSLIQVDAASGLRAGLTTWWSLHGTTSTAALRAAWDAYGLPAELAPGPVSPAKALKRILYEQAAKRSATIRPLGSGAFAVVADNRQGEGADATLDPSETLRVWWDSDVEAVKIRSSHLGSEAEAAWTSAVQGALDLLEPEDVSTWLVRVVDRYCAGISLRDSGGIYYIPEAKAGLWSEVREVVGMVAPAHRIHEIPSLRSDRLVDAVMETLQAWAENEVAALEAELREVAASLREGGKYKTHRLAPRKARAESILARIGEYDGLLGGALGALQSRASDLQASLGEALLSDGEDLLAAMEGWL